MLQVVGEDEEEALRRNEKCGPLMSDVIIVAGEEQ